MSDNYSVQGAILVGSLTLPTAGDTFRTVSEHLGGHVKRIPDGEVGARFHWILFQGAAFDATPGLRRIGAAPVIVAGFDLRPLELDGSLAPADLEFGELGYASAAIASYAAFIQLRQDGVIRPGTRFQVSLPTPIAPISTYVYPAARADVEPAYTRALAREIKRICAAIPAGDLAIQFDLAIEFAYLETAAGREVTIASTAWFEPLFDGLIERAGGIAASVPEGVELGFHLCYGDVGERHFVQPLDAGTLTTVANGLAAAVDRTINWIHLPVPINRTDAAYFDPLTDLRLDPATELYLGLLHHEDGVAGANARIDAAHAAGVTGFGVGTECGFGRGPAERTGPLLDLHAALAQPW